MTHLLQRGRLEVETDLLLGAEEVLLPRGIAAQVAINEAAEHAPRVARSISPAPSPAQKGFDAALFAPSPTGQRQAHAAADTTAAPRTAPRPVAPSATTAAPVAFTMPSMIEVVSAPAVVHLVESVVAPAGASKAERLARLDELHAKQCPHCTTATAHTQLVFGEGNADAEVVFVGEAPGETEDRLGRPFVGRAGEKLDEMIGAMGLARSEVYIANVLKSRPPDNRTPLAHEVERCGPYLLAQLSVIRPKVIVTLGGPATKLLLASELGITRLRGVFASVKLGTSEGAPFEVPVMPTFHPAYLLRNYTPETRMQVWEDLKKVLGALGRAVPSRK